MKGINMNIKTIPIDDLKPYAHNPKQHPAEQIEKIARSITEFGFLVPILIDADNLIIAGHGRLMAACKLGLVEVPTIRVDHLTEAQIQAYRIADNKLTESLWDLDMLESEISILQDMDFDIDLTGFDDIEIGELFSSDPEPEDFDADAAMDDESPPLVQTGELWILGDHRLLCGDSTKSEDVERLMDGEKMDMVFTDPPYGIDIVRGNVGDLSKGRVAQPAGPRKSGPVKGKIVNPKVYRKVVGDDRPFDPTFLLNLADTILLFGANNFASRLPDTPGWLVWDKGISEKADFSSCELIWCNVGGHIRRYSFMWSGLIRAGSRDAELKERVHPTQKPVGLLSAILEDYSKPDQSVLDLFGGSGSTLIACEQLNRRCYMMELDPHYCDVILDRWANYTKEDPIREDGMLWSELKESQQL